MVCVAINTYLHKNFAWKVIIGQVGIPPLFRMQHVTATLRLCPKSCIF